MSVRSSVPAITRTRPAASAAASASVIVMSTNLGTATAPRADSLGTGGWLLAATAREHPEHEEARRSPGCRSRGARRPSPTGSSRPVVLALAIDGRGRRRRAARGHRGRRRRRARVGVGRIRDGVRAGLGAGDGGGGATPATAAPAAAAPATAAVPGVAGSASQPSRALAIDAAEAYRAAGSSAMARWTIWSSSGGTPGRIADGRGGVVVRRASATAAAPSPENGRCAGERLVQDDAQRVDVRRLGRGLAARLLGAEVVDGAHRHARQRQLRLVERAGDAEVGDLHAPVAADQHVRGLDVAVDDARARGRPGAPSATSAETRAAWRGGSGAVLAEDGRQVLPVDQLHDDVRAGPRPRRSRRPPRCSGG